MIIKRDKYLQALIDRMHNGMIKIVTGIRRSGKSYLIFNIFKSYLLDNGIRQDHIISMELDRRENLKFLDPDLLLDHIKSQIKDKEDYFVLLDEIQLVGEFESVLNSLLHIENVDVFVTGSNSKFLSKDIITEFRGRGDEIHLFPLSFSEYMQAYGKDIYQGWRDYTTYGGLPRILSIKTPEQKIKYLTDLFNTVYLKDILERNNIGKTQELENLINILASQIGSLTNATNIENTYMSLLHKNFSTSTIQKYIDYLENAFIISCAHRYNVKGRKYIGSPLKYYFEDVGLRNARLGFRQTEENHVMENIIYNELRYRGFLVDVGVVQTREKDKSSKLTRKQLEIDFVANLGSKRYYLQSAFEMRTETKKEQEKKSLKKIDDSFKKIILVKDVINVERDDDGIITMSVYDFLLHDNSLEF